VTLALKRARDAADSPVSRTNLTAEGQNAVRSAHDRSRLVFSTALTLSIVLSAFGAVPGPQREKPPHPRPKVVSNLLRSDMTAPHEAPPHGVPSSYDWARGPRPRRAAPPADFTAFTAWGQLYRCAGARFDPAETVELRDLETWLLVGGHWKRAQRSSALGGAAFAEDYVGPPAAARLVARGPKGSRVRMRVGRNFHFWPAAGRVRFDARRVTDVAVVVRARRVDGGSKAGCLTLSVGADYWRSLTAPAAGSGNAVDAGIGRFKRVDGNWRAFSMTTASADALARHPVPLRLAERELR
jgi:hypothetical protein